MMVDPSVVVDPFETAVSVVDTDPKLPEYGLPEAAVIAIPLSTKIY